jgi:2-methylcitrate dehydratase
VSTEPYLIDELAGFVLEATPADIPDDAVMLLRRNILDSLGCAIGGLDGEVPRAIRAQVESVAAAPRATLIGGGKSSIEQAALFNSVAVRYIDQLDTYLSPGGLCHPADNFGALLAVAEGVGATGTEFTLALAIAYELQCRFSASVPVMARGLNHALQLAMSVAAGSARLLGLNHDQTANAMAIAMADNVSLAAIHSEPVSNWKGISPGITAQRAVYTTELAGRGITGPRAIFEGPNGLERLFDQQINMRLTDRTLAVVRDTYLKKYCALIHGQAPIDAVLTLARQQRIDHLDIESVEADVIQNGYEIAGGGSFGDKDAPRTKEQADYNLKYLLAAALIDNQIGPEQLDAQRIVRADIQNLLTRVHIRPSAEMTARYPQATPVRINIVLRDGRRYTHEQDDFEGAPHRPLTWDRTIQKFDWLAEPHADANLRSAITHTVQHLGEHPVTVLTDFLAAVRPARHYPRTHQSV